MFSLQVFEVSEIAKMLADRVCSSGWTENGIELKDKLWLGLG